MQFRLRMLFLLCVLLWSSLNVFGIGGGILVFGLAVALAIWIRWTLRLWIAAALATIIGLVWTVSLSVGPACQGCVLGRFPFCANNMKSIALALQNYCQANGCLPPAYITDKNGRPMHSWRALILPYIDSALANRYNFNEPWDGPNNKKLQQLAPKQLRSPVDFFVCPEDTRTTQGKPLYTNYLAVVGPNSAWRGEKAMSCEDIRPFSQTILLVEVAGSDVVWTEPRDFDASTALSSHPPMVISSRHPRKQEFFYYTASGGANVVLADGSVLFLTNELLASRRLPDVLKIGGLTEDDRTASVRRRFHWPNCLALVVWCLSVSWLQYRAWQGRRRMIREVANSRAPAAFL